jgi:hypothetical protein
MPINWCCLSKLSLCGSLRHGESDITFLFTLFPPFVSFNCLTSLFQDQPQFVHGTKLFLVVMPHIRLFVNGKYNFTVFVWTLHRIFDFWSGYWSNFFQLTVFIFLGWFVPFLSISGGFPLVSKQRRTIRFNIIIFAFCVTHILS